MGRGVIISSQKSSQKIPSIIYQAGWQDVISYNNNGYSAGSNLARGCSCNSYSTPASGSGFSFTVDCTSMRLLHDRRKAIRHYAAGKFRLSSRKVHDRCPHRNRNHPARKSRMVPVLPHLGRNTQTALPYWEKRAAVSGWCSLSIMSMSRIHGKCRNCSDPVLPGRNRRRTCLPCLPLSMCRTC